MIRFQHALLDRIFHLVLIQDRIRQLLTFTMIFISFFLAGFFNFFNSTTEDDFFNWQKDGQIRGYFGAGEAGFLNRIESDLTTKNNIPFGCLLTNIESPAVPERLYLNKTKGINYEVQYQPYTSSICGYAFIVSYLYRATPIDSLSKIYLIQIFLFSILITLLLNFFNKEIGKLFAFTYFISMLFSPWITSAIRNLYWSPWIWLLPVYAAILYSNSEGKRSRLLSSMALYLTFVFKFWATGFEMFTSIIIFAAVIPALRNLNNKIADLSIFAILKESLYVFLIGIIGFFSVLILQINLLPGNFVTGLKYLLRESILRRTYGNPNNYEIDYQASLTANIFQVIEKYLFDWNKSILELSFAESVIRVSGQLFFPIVIVSTILLIRKIYKKNTQYKQLSLLFISGFALALSWFISAKGHSYIHTHILFVLWYLMLIPTLLFIIIDSALNRLLRITNSMRNME